jgi:hypothetical protein
MLQGLAVKLKLINRISSLVMLIGGAVYCVGFVETLPIRVSQAIEAV